MKHQRNFSFIKSLFYERRLKLICVLACAVVVCTVSALVIPAIAQDGVAHCGIKEHSHSDACYEKKLICGQDEDTGHVHTDECYDSILSCEKTEHTHELSCYSDPDADVETAENWENTFSKVELSGDYREDVMAIAKTQLGYKESEKNYKVDENGDAKGYTRYGAWYGDKYGDWYAMFVSFCLDYAKVELPDGGKTCADWIKSLSAKECARYHDAKDYAPKQGDLVFLDSDKDGQADRMGFVAELTKATEEKAAGIKTIEGDSNNSVEYVEYEQADKKIIGYGQIPEKSDKTTIAYEGKDYTVSVSYEKEAKIPEGTELSVKEITGEEYDKTCAKAKKALNADELGFARFFDISLIKDGKELEPAAPVDVSITYQDEVKIAAGESASAVHFVDSGVEVLKAEVDSSKTAGAKTEKETVKGDTFSFTQDSFSVTGTVVAVNSLKSDEEYMIITKSSAGPYYALAGDGTGVMIKSYDEKTKEVVLFRGTDAEALKWKYGSDTKKPLYNEATKNYLALTGNGVVVSKNISTNYALNISTTGGGREQYQVTISRRLGWTSYAPTYSLGFDPATGNFATGNAVVVYFVGDITETEDTSGSGSNAERSYNFPNNKKIDYLGDGNADKDKNPDTNVKGEDLYRLYLDISGNTEPMDLLIVIDRSGSMAMDMSGKQDGERGFNSEQVRHKLVTQLLNGTETGVTDEGLISRFLSLNSKNKVAVTTFEGKAVEDNGTDTWNEALANNGYISDDYFESDPKKDPYRYTKDCDTIMEWVDAETYQSNKKFVNAAAKRWNGTNYMAGLVRADSMLDQVKNDGNKKMMIFISDGVPTYYLEDPNNNGQYSRGGDHGQTNSQDIVDGCRDKTIEYFGGTFIKKHNDLIVHTVGISSEINGANFNSNPLALKYMADEGGGGFLPVTKAEDMDEIENLIFPSGTQITDKLSSYVQYYDTDSDLKLVRTSDDGSTTQVLFENGAVTPDGKGILDSVVYTPAANNPDSTGTVTANFAEGFIMDKGFTYTLSFNVKATDKAYERYAKGDAAVSGDADTDYGQNATSSGKDGLHSNKDATVQYNINNIKYTEDYPKPVIQVDKCQLTLTKTDEAGDPLKEVSFLLKRGNDTVGTYTTDSNGKIEIPSSALLNGDYTLEETSEVDGYIKTTEVVTFTVKNGMITHTGTYNDWTWEPDPEKAGNASANQYPKDNTYPYALSLINRSKPQQVLLQKIDEKNAPLNGATFSLYRDCAPTEPDGKSFRITAGNKEETVWGIPVEAKQDMTSRDATIDGASLGGVIYNGELDGGKYYMLETAAPDGYHRLEEPVVITVSKEGVKASYCGKPTDVTTDGKDPATYTVKISNTRGYILPNTGGSGTGWYTPGGILLMTVALLCYIKKRRRKEAKVL